MKRSYGSSLKHFWEIAKLYWFGNEKSGALSLLLLLVVFLLTSTWLGVALNTQQGVIISALATKETSRFWRAILNFVVILLSYAPLLAGFNYITGKLGNYWRQWLTGHLLSGYLSNRNFYSLVGNSEIDNPDQRISEDIKSFTQDSLKFLLLVVGYVFQVIAFSGVLWQIYKPLFFLIIVYGLLGSILTVLVFGRPLVGLRFEQLRKEANFRFGLVHIRDNAESIAFYRGESQESKMGMLLFREVFNNFNSIINWQFYLDLVAKIFAFIPYVIPPIALATKVFSGELEVGKVSEAIGAFILVFTALGFIVKQFQSLTTFGAGIERLHTFSQTLDKQGKLQDSSQSHPEKIQTINNDSLAIQNLTLLTPNYFKILFRNLSLELELERGLLIIGESGCGKSSLLRAIAGLWDSGTGKIIRPTLDNMLFLPQRPYMTLGSLRSQLLYPKTNFINTGDEHLNHILHQVNLPNLVERLGSLDVEKVNWSDVLSIGEQQRIAFARLLIAKPQYAILDEATSALDVTNEGHLYEQLVNSGITYISVGHRPTLEKYHHLVLEILENGEWRLREPV